MNELKKCPFCGGEALMQHKRVNGDPRFTHSWVVCTVCYSQTTQFLSEKQAIEAWNRRADNDE